MLLKTCSNVKVFHNFSVYIFYGGLKNKKRNYITTSKEEKYTEILGKVMVKIKELLKKYGLRNDNNETGQYNET